MSFKDLTGHLQGVCGDVFGESVTYRPVTGSPYEVTGIFNEKSVLLDSATGAIRSEGPTLGVRLSDLTAPPLAGVSGDKVTIRSGLYQIVDRIDDGEGGSVLVLHEAP